MGRLGLRLDQDIKEEVMSASKNYFASPEEFYNSIGPDRKGFSNHINGQSEAINVEDFYEMTKLVNRSGSRFEREDAENMGLESKRMVLNHFSPQDLEDYFDKTYSTIRNYQKGRSNSIPEEPFQEVLDDFNSIMSHEVRFTAEVVDMGVMGVSEPEVLAEINEEDLMEFGMLYKRLSKDVREGIYTRGMLNSLDNLDSLFEKPYPKPVNKPEGTAYSLLAEAGFLERWGGSTSPYERIVEDDYVYAAARYLETIGG